VDQELKRIACSLVWWKPPEAVETGYLVRRVMEMGTAEMVRCIRGRLGETAMREALEHAEAGNFSEPSWNYWHVFFGLRPTPPLPSRMVCESPHVSAEIGNTAARPARDVAAAG
jgi:hypothetical protein